MHDHPERRPAESLETAKSTDQTRDLTRKFKAKSGQHVAYSPHDYLFNLAAKVVVYVASNAKPLYPELRGCSPALTHLHKYLSPASPDRLPLASTYEKDWVLFVIEALHNSPALQQPLAYIVDYVPSKWLLEQEAAVICRARTIHGRNSHPWLSLNQSAAPWNRNDPTTWQAPDAIYNWACQAQLRGMCLSGGGIRSATFNLGILQGLAAKQKLDRFDYLSSVSGGGYIHAWLAGWLRRESGRKQQELPHDEAVRAALKQVQEEMSPIPGPAQSGVAPHGFAPHEIRWLRRFSNYLTPQKGLLTLDTWTAVAIWLRNTFLNQLFLVSTLLCLLLVPWLLAKAWPLPAGVCDPLPSTPTQATLKMNALGEELTSDKFKLDYCLALSAEFDKAPTTSSSCLKEADAHAAQRAVAAAVAGTQTDPATTIILECVSFGLFLAGAFSLGYLLWQEVALIRGLDENEPPHAAAKKSDPCHRPYLQEAKPGRAFGKPVRIRFILASLLSPAVPFCYALCCPGPGRLEVIFAAIALLCLTLCVAVGGSAFALPGISRSLLVRLGTAAKRLLAALGASIFGTVIFVLIAALIRTATVEYWGAHLMRCSVPALELALGVPLLASIPFLTISILIGLVGHNFFDWLRELLGRLLAWTLLFTFGWLGLFAIALLSPGLFLVTVHASTLKVSAIVAWIATTAASVMSGKSSKTDGSAPATKSGFTAELLATIGPYVYILGLLVVLSSLVKSGVDAEQPLPRIGIAIAVCGGLAGLLRWRLDANAFSLFPFYRNRLTRCYLGASNRSRDPNPLTGFDDRDTSGLQLSCLRPDQGYPGPFPIFNATLNLTTGTELAYQERKGASFAFTPLYTGYAVNWTEGAAGTQFNGFVPTETYAAPEGGLSIASAIAISGAAVSPNMGYHSKPATAFLLTMFNARLGCWLPNTRRHSDAGKAAARAHSRAAETNSPNGGVLFNELLGFTDDSREYVYLSDGGHFDNMGLYELVRRRCYDIVICDAEEDEDYIFDGVGQTIRKCRIDFGVEISLDFSKLRCVAKTRFSSAHVVTGSIRYPEARAGQQGKVTYIKASLVTFKSGSGPEASPSDLPDLPGDVQSYYLQHEQFPHDSTLEQWFTESQFESYRRLGEAVIEGIASLG